MAANVGLYRTEQGALVSGLLLPLRGLGQDNSVRVQIQPQSRLGRIPADFMGLGYEVSSVSERRLLAASNRAYVQMVRSSPKSSVADRRGVLNLGTFVRATGWRLIWGFNLGRGSIDPAVDVSRPRLYFRRRS